MHIRTIKSFLQVYEDKKFSTASKKLNITQQGLSRLIHSMEDELDVQLFERTKKGLKLTQYSKMIQPHLLKIVSEYDKMLNEIDEKANGVMPKIRLGISHCVLPAIGMKFITAFNAQYPDFKISIINLMDDDCDKLLADGELDVAFLIDPVDENIFDYSEVFAGNGCVVVHKDHKFAKNNEIIKLDQLHNERVFATSTQYKMRRKFDEECEKKGVKPNVAISSSESLGYIKLADENLGIVISLGFLCEEHTENTVVIPLESDSIFKVYLCTNKNKELNKASKIFIDYLKSYFDI